MMQIHVMALREPRKAGQMLGRALLTFIAAVGMAGCEHDRAGTEVAGWSLIAPAERHPILVSQQPANLSLRVAANSDGLSPMQRARVLEFVDHGRAADV